MPSGSRSEVFERSEATTFRARDLLESAVMMPQASFGGQYVHNGIYEMAAAYAFHIAENQPFVDGKKSIHKYYQQSWDKKIRFIFIRQKVLLQRKGELQ